MRTIPVFGKRVTQMREQRHMDMQELATRSGTSYQTIWRIERGVHKEPGIYIAARIARALGVSLDYLCDVYETEQDTDDTEDAPSVAYA
ncbi:MAG: helix-turn-helix domain-containing protein [Nitrospiraceae bacterium]